MNCSYNPNKNNIKNYVETISRTSDIFYTKYKNILLLGDFNACVWWDHEIFLQFLLFKKSDQTTNML